MASTSTPTPSGDLDVAAKNQDILNSPPSAFKDFIRVSDLPQHVKYRIVDLEVKRYKDYGLKLTADLMIEGKRRTLFLSPTFLDDTPKFDTLKESVNSNDLACWVSLEGITTAKKKKKIMKIPKYDFKVLPKTAEDRKLDLELAAVASVLSSSESMKKKQKRSILKIVNGGDKTNAKKDGKKPLKKEIISSDGDQSNEDDYDDDDDEDFDEDMVLDETSDEVGNSDIEEEEPIPRKNKKFHKK